MVHGNLHLVISRHAEAWVEDMPLEWLFSSLTARYDRKRSTFDYLLPLGTRLDIFDGRTDTVLIVTGHAQAHHLRMARVEGNVSLG